MFRTFETEFTGRKLVVETGKMAQLTNGSALVRFGDTVVMVNVTASKKPREGVDFLFCAQREADGGSAFTEGF